MMYFTADEHYGLKNIIEYCDRPFRDVEEMDAILIKNHNEIVGINDIVYHLGDFTLKGKEEANKYMDKLNGIHIFIKGSHDYWAKEEFPYIKELDLKPYHIVLCHYAMRTWPRSYHGSIQLYGHSHGKLKANKNQLDVGVDSHNFYPISFDKIKETL